MTTNMKSAKMKSRPTHRVNEKLEALVRSRGWAVVTVSGSPGFSYSVGLAERELPEIIVFGVGTEQGPKIVGDYARSVIERGPMAINSALEGVIDGFRAVLRRLTSPEAEQYLKAAWVRSAGAMTAMQMVWPDPKGNFPWEGGFDASFLSFQPLLGEHPLSLGAA